MISKIITNRILLVAILILVGLGVSYTLSSPANAQAGLVCDGLSLDPDVSGDDCGTTADGQPGVTSTIKLALEILSIVAGVIAVVMILIAGVKFVTSQGDPGKVASARTTVIYAVIGLIVVALAQSIIFFALKKATYTPTQFEQKLLGQ